MPSKFSKCSVLTCPSGVCKCLFSTGENQLCKRTKPMTHCQADKYKAGSFLSLRQHGTHRLEACMQYKFSENQDTRDKCTTSACQMNGHCIAKNTSGVERSRAIKVQAASAAAHTQLRKENNKEPQGCKLQALGSAALDSYTTIIGNGSILPFSQSEHTIYEHIPKTKHFLSSLFHGKVEETCSCV